MKNNTASNKLGRLVTTARFEAITEMVLNAHTLKHLMTFTWSNIPSSFIEALREAFSHDKTRIDMRKTATWEALASAIVAYEALSTVDTPLEPTQTPSESSQVIEKTPIEVWHLDDLSWREERVMQMGDWHPHFKTVERSLVAATAMARKSFLEYTETLLRETEDDPDDLLRHLHEEVVTYLANKLIEAVDEVWSKVKPVTPRPYCTGKATAP